jgi:hypothetical protein
MRTWTLALSVFAHAVIVAAILVAPIFATADLPDPHRPFTFETITPIETPAIPVTPRSQTTPPATRALTMPLSPPSELPPDSSLQNSQVKGQRSKAQVKGQRCRSKVQVQGARQRL